MNKSLLLIITIIITFTSKNIAQEYSENSIKVGLGIGISEGLRETGVGLVFSAGFQKSMWEDRFRINPEFRTGGYYPYLITDTRDQFFRVTSIGVNAYLDVIRVKPISLFIGAGAQLNYSRGLLGTGGMNVNNTESEYFFKFYYAGIVALGLRFDNPDKRIAFEFTPINAGFGNDSYFNYYAKIGVDIKLNKNES